MISRRDSEIELTLIAPKRRNRGACSSTTNLQPRARPAIALTLLALGFALSLNALYIPVKAVLAQWLLDRAWSASLQSGSMTVRPWPWADTNPIARLTTEIDGELIDQLILSGASDRNLAFGPAHVLPSARPGNNGHVVISGHRDTHLRWLGRLAIGAQIVLESHENRQMYQTISSEIIDLAEQQLHLSLTEDLLTLVTCYPLDGVLPGTSERYLVHARLIEKT